MNASLLYGGGQNVYNPRNICGENQWDAESYLKLILCRGRRAGSDS